MFRNLILAAAAVLAILWAIGFDFLGVKDSMIGMADSAAESLTGSDLRS